MTLYKFTFSHISPKGEYSIEPSQRENKYNSIFINQYQTLFRNEEPTSYITPWVMSLFFIFHNSPSILYISLNIFIISQLCVQLNIFSLEWISPTILSFPIMKGTLENLLLCTIVEKPLNSIYYCRSSINHYHMMREIFQRISPPNSWVMFSFSPN